jgi:hypothetical protein
MFARSVSHDDERSVEKVRRLNRDGAADGNHVSTVVALKQQATTNTKRVYLGCEAKDVKTRSRSSDDEFRLMNEHSRWWGEGPRD